MKKHPLNVESWASEDCRGFRSKGHHNLLLFMEDVFDYNGDRDESMGNPRHVFTKVVPSPDGCICVEVKPGTRGSYPETVCDDHDVEDKFDWSKLAKDEK